MKHSDFDFVLDIILAQIKVLLSNKAKEYASDSDRFHNFVEAARQDNISVLEAMRGMDLKHRISIHDILESAKETGKLPEIAIAKEKYIDHINYMLLELIYILNEKEQEILSF